VFFHQQESMITYPPAPWTLRGSAILSVRPADIARVYPLLPKGLEPVAIWPGKTLEGLCLAAYRQDSTLEYNELIVAAALVRHSGRRGLFISRIYVDHPASVRGGQEIWGLPKERAEFRRDQRRTEVWQEGRLLCALAMGGRAIPAWRMRFSLPAFGLRGTEPLRFVSAVRARPALIRARWHVPDDSPLSALRSGCSLLSLRLDDLHAVVPEPDSPAAF
jgi:acetoacetate decarboxylase